jgi:hypothetical protein
MRGSLLLLPAAFALISATNAPVPLRSSDGYDALFSTATPPFRFQGDAVMKIHFVHDVTADNACGKAGHDAVFVACNRGSSIFMPNPCGIDETYAKRLCHELGHKNRWGAYHEH